MTGGEIAAAALAGKIVTQAGKAITDEEKSAKAELLEQAKETPEFAEGARQLAKRIAIRQEIITNCYKPIAKLFGVANHYFDNDFDKDMATKLADVPEENIVAPKASLAAPAMLQLGFSLDEPDLKEMYLSLLATASDDRVADTAHPSFVEVIKQISSVETSLLNYILVDPVNVTPMATLKLVTEGQPGWRVLQRHIMPLADTTTGEAAEVPNLATYVENWLRLGLVEVSYSEFATGEGVYDYVENRPEYKRYEASLSDGQKIEVAKGYIRSTAFGESFARAVGIISDDPKT